MRYIVGYTNSSRGKDAVQLAVTLARGTDVTLEIVVVTPEPRQSFDMYSPDRAFYSELEAQAEEWLDDAMRLVPADIKARPRHYLADSIAEGLIDSVTDDAEEASLIVVGASRRGIVGRYTIGSTASTLLHSSPVPVALATAGYGVNHQAVSRLTCATGTKPGADALVDLAVATAKRRQIDLRLVSLVPIDRAGDEDRAAVSEQHAKSLAKRATQTLDKKRVSTVLARGTSIEECVSQLPFDDDEIVMVGSNRLAGHRRLFIGSTASKMLRTLPVPMIVVPRDHEEALA